MWRKHGELRCGSAAFRGLSVTSDLVEAVAVVGVESEPAAGIPVGVHGADTVDRPDGPLVSGTELGVRVVAVIQFDPVTGLVVLGHGGVLPAGMTGTRATARPVIGKLEQASRSGVVRVSRGMFA